MARPRIYSDAERKIRKKEYSLRPDVIAKRKEKSSSPEAKAKRKIRESRPDVKKKIQMQKSTISRLWSSVPENKDRRNREKREQSDEKRAKTNRHRNITRNKRYDELRNSLIAILGGPKCVECGYKDNPKALDIDHISNTGHLDKKWFKRKRKDDFYRHYKNNPIDARKYLQVLCANCNHIKFKISNQVIRDEKNNLRYMRDKEKSNELKNSLIAILGGPKCVECGYTDTSSLQIDHIHSDGNLDKKRFSGLTNKFRRYYINHQDQAKNKLQVLCANCNQIKARVD